MRMNTDRMTGLILFTLTLCFGGCTNTDEVIESWRGQPIEAVVEQWGPPGFYESVTGDTYDLSELDIHARTNSREQPIHVGANTYTWEYITHTYHAERCEVVKYQDGCKTVTKTRITPAHWSHNADHFYLTTNEGGKVDGGGSSYEQKIWPMSLIIEHRTGWGSLRRGWNPDQIDQLAVE